jgi:membrane protein DedA with SNARE-associated domain
MITAALFGAILGFSLGGMFINRRTRKKGSALCSHRNRFHATGVPSIRS